MRTIGLVGGVASGKSLVAKMLVELGAGLLDADRTGHAVINEEPDVREAIRKRWGDSVFQPEGTISRPAVARLVFGDGTKSDAELQFLQDLMHPRIGRRLQEIGQQMDADGKPAIVLDAPLLLEAGWKPFCDIILFVDVPRPIRLERAKQRGWTEADFDGRDAAQVSIDEKRRLADFTIYNTGSEDELRAAVREFWTTHVAPLAGGH
jgi:dephospho-CoA kinase